jgi:hypothetical protein
MSFRGVMDLLILVCFFLGVEDTPAQVICGRGQAVRPENR